MLLRRLLLLCLLTSHLLALPGLARAATSSCQHAPAAVQAKVAGQAGMADHAAMGHGRHQAVVNHPATPNDDSGATPDCHCGCACAANHCLPGGGLALPQVLSLWSPPALSLVTPRSHGKATTLPAHLGTRLRPPDRAAL
jgi:hypothetical protein